MAKMTPEQSVIVMLLSSDVPQEGYWWGVNETGAPQYKGRAITPEEQAVLDAVEAFDSGGRA